MKKITEVEMATKKTSHGLVDAAKEHLLQGNTMTRLEAMIFFGVSNLPEVVYELRREGFIIKTKSVPMAKAVVRVNLNARLDPPPNLPIKEIHVTEYWISK